MESPFLVGCRVKDAEGYKATVRYIGPVAAAKNQEETWLGVEWDNQTRGKHDGSCVDSKGDLHRYFECADGAGSFIKPAKVEAGRSLVTVLTERYVALDAPEITEAGTNVIPNAFVTTSKGHQKGIEFYGEQKLRKWQQLSAIQKVTVRNSDVSCMGDGDELASLAGHLIEVDVQDNLIWEWAEIGKLGSQLPQLTSLLLHGNKMQPITVEICDTMKSYAPFTHLRVLALHGCRLTSWASMQLLEPLLPELEELYLPGNSLQDLPNLQQELDYQAATGITSEPLHVVSGFSSLRLLDISACGLVDWSQVTQFGQLPSLRELVLDCNELPSVSPPPTGAEGALPAFFATLQRFSISSSGLAAWSDIDNLSKYTGLRVLRLSHIPLFKGRGASEVRPLVIARMQHVEVFNGSPVSARERMESEKSYLRLALRERDEITEKEKGALASADSPPPPPSGGSLDPPPTSAAMKEFLSRHPRLLELDATYGADLVPMGDTTKGASTIAEGLLTITFKNLSFGSNGTLEPQTKKLPRTLTVGKLRLTVKQMFGLDPKLQDLSLRCYKDAPPVFLDDEQATLQYFGAIDGADIFVNEAKAK